VKEWKQNPRRLDLEGVDTPQTKKKIEKPIVHEEKKMTGKELTREEKELYEKLLKGGMAPEMAMKFIRPDPNATPEPDPVPSDEEFREWAKENLKGIPGYHEPCRNPDDFDDDEDDERGYIDTPYGA
jgi:hypothetical protein